MTGELQSSDGRIARGQRTRQAIIAAHTGLIREGHLKPTAEMVARRAGVSVRTLWKNFGDLEGLLHETTAHWLAEDQALVQPIDPALPLDQRIERFCDQRARRLEHLGPAARSAALGEPFSQALQESRRHHVRANREDVARTFGHEIGNRSETLHGVLVAASWPAWSLLRDDYGLDVSAATAVMAASIRALLGG